MPRDFTDEFESELTTDLLMRPSDAPAMPLGPVTKDPYVQKLMDVFLSAKSDFTNSSGMPNTASGRYEKARFYAETTDPCVARLLNAFAERAHSEFR